jgi:DNA-binding MarR family transcriptional regulator
METLDDIPADVTLLDDEPVCPATACVGHTPPQLPPAQAAAWGGFLLAHAEITRMLDQGLTGAFGLSLNALDVLARISAASDGRVRITDLAHGALLSPSRASRIVDALEARGLLERTSCPSDSRGVFAQITEEGRELANRAQAWLWASVQERFFGPLSEGQVEEMGRVWSAVLGSCAADALRPPE